MANRDSLPYVIESRLPDKSGRARTLRYELRSVLGQGGMATVYLAQDLTPPDWYVRDYGDKPRLVVLKFPHEAVLENSADALDRFIREANLLKAVDHPNITHIWNMGVDQDTQPFIVMELVENARSLDSIKTEYWERFLDGQGRSEDGKIERSLVPASELIPKLEQVLDALEALHVMTIVHRDIKPENILVTKQEDGREVIKLTDLGISKSLNPQLGPNLTSQGVVVGTPFYMSPEAAMECKIHPETREVWHVGPWSDFWSLGASTFELMTGFLPFDADANELRKPTAGVRSEALAEQLMARLVLAKVVDSKIPHRSVNDFVHNPNPALVEFIDRCLTKDPWARPGKPDELRALLRKADEWERTHKLPATSSNSRKASWRVADSLAPTRELLSNPPPQPPATSEVAGRSGLSRSKVALVPAVILTFGAIVLLAWLFDLHGRFIDSRPELEASVAATASSVAPVASAVPSAATTASAKRAPGSGPEPGSRDYGIYQRGLAAYSQGNCIQAKRFMNGVLAVHPSFPPAMKVLGECALRSRNYEEARQYLGMYESFDGVEPLSAQARNFMQEGK